MARKTPEEIAQKQLWKTAEGALPTFLEGEQTINWLIGLIRYSNVRGQELAKNFKTWKDYGDPNRYQEAIVACREQGWLN